MALTQSFLWDMRLPLRLALRGLPLLLAVGLTTWSACDDEDAFVAPSRTPLDIWREDVRFIDATNVPEVQIDRFVEANAMDTVMTASGLVYQLDAAGGAERPSPGDSVVVNYKGYLVTGATFDQTFVEFGPQGFDIGNAPEQGRLIEAWEEGLQYMGRGGRMWMVARPDLAYGDSGRPRSGIPPSAVLLFEIELVDFVDRTP